MSNREIKYHDFYLCGMEPDVGSGFLVKQVNSKGKVLIVSKIPLEELEWFQRDKDFVIVSRSEWDEIGIGEEL